MKIRDILAIPFWLLATVCDKLAVKIGGRWTANMYIEGVIKQAKYLQETIKRLK